MNDAKYLFFYTYLQITIQGRQLHHNWQISTRAHLLYVSHFEVNVFVFCSFLFVFFVCVPTQTLKPHDGRLVIRRKPFAIVSSSTLFSVTRRHPKFACIAIHANVSARHIRRHVRQCLVDITNGLWLLYGSSLCANPPRQLCSVDIVLRLSRVVIFVMFAWLGLPKR